MDERLVQISYIVNSAISLGMIYYGFTCLFKPAVRKIWIFLAYGVFLFISTSLFFHFGSGWLNLAFNIVGTLGIALLFTEKISTRFIFSLLLYILTIVADAISFTGLSYIHYRHYGTELPPEVVIFVVRTVTNIIFLPLLLISTIAFRKFSKRNVRNSYFKIPVTYTISTLALLLGIILINIRLILAEIRYIQTTLVNLMTSQFIVLVIIFFVIWLYNALLDHLDAREKNRQKDLLLERWEIQYGTTMEAQEIISGLKHNLKYHFLALLGFAKNSEVTKIEHYIKNELGSFTSVINTGNMCIDAMLNYYIQRIKEFLEIDLETNIRIPAQLILNANRTAVILGNALENAMEACAQVPHSERYIRVNAIVSRNEALLITIENPYTTLPVTDKDNKLITTKTDKRRHGFGLSSIQELLADETGSVDIEYADGIFRFKLLLYDVI